MDIGSRLMLARKQQRLSMRDLAEMAGLSATAISKYENGKAVPRPSTLLRLGRALGVKADFFLRENTVYLAVPAYRKHSRLGKREQESVKATIIEAMERYLQIEAIRPTANGMDFVLPSYEVSTPEDAENAADSLRETWDLGTDSIDSLCGVLESRGVRVVMLDGPDRFDGFCGLINEILPVIAYNGRLPGDRQRFTLAHELGHLVLATDDESLAHRFAGAFLVPGTAAYRELGRQRTRLSTEELTLLKRKYGMSIQAWIMRACQLGIISDSCRQGTFRRLSVLGMRTVEPGHVPPEQPERMELLVHQALAEDLISPSAAARMLGIEQRVEVSASSKELEEAAVLLAQDYEEDGELTEFSRADLGGVVDDPQ